MRNVNHRNFYEDQVPTVEEAPKVEEAPVVENIPVVDEDIEEDVEEADEVTLTEEEVYDMTKKEQISLLEELGLDKSEIKKLKYEDDRVEKILEYIGYFNEGKGDKSKIKTVGGYCRYYGQICG